MVGDGRRRCGRHAADARKPAASSRWRNRRGLRPATGHVGAPIAGGQPGGQRLGVGADEPEQRRAAAGLPRQPDEVETGHGGDASDVPDLPVDDHSGYVQPRVVAAVPGRPHDRADVDAVVWATGYRPDHSWLHVPGAVVDGQLRHTAGSTDVPGLHMLGLPWQTCRGSALLGFVGADAEALAARLTPAAGTTGVPGCGPAIPVVSPA